MKLVFSEANADYAHYIFPYVVWGFPEASETAADFFERGFLPSSRYLDRFYLCRQVRVALAQFSPSSENRRILRKGEGITCRLVPRQEFDFTPERREFFKSYADNRLGKETITYERLDALFSAPIISHVLIYTETQTGAEIGYAAMYLQESALAFYYYAFYDLTYLNKNLGMFMMTSAVEFFANRGFKHIYLGTCYSKSALYKTQFTGLQFFNGYRWSENLEELKHMIKRGETVATEHLLENKVFLDEYCDGTLEKVASASGFRLPTKN